MDVIDDKRRRKLYYIYLLVFDKYWEYVFKNRHDSHFGARSKSQVRIKKTQNIPPSTSTTADATSNVSRTTALSNNTTNTTGRTDTTNETAVVTNNSTTTNASNALTITKNSAPIEELITHLKQNSSPRTLQKIDNIARKMYIETKKNEKAFDIFFEALWSGNLFRLDTIKKISKSICLSYYNFFVSPNYDDFKNANVGVITLYASIGMFYTLKSWNDFNNNKNNFANLFIEKLQNNNTITQDISKLYYDWLLPKIPNITFNQAMFTFIVKCMYLSKLFGGTISGQDFSNTKKGFAELLYKKTGAVIPSTTSFVSEEILNSFTFSFWDQINHLCTLVYSSTTSNVSYRDQSDTLLRNVLTTGIQGGRVDFPILEQIPNYETLKVQYGDLGVNGLMNAYFGVDPGTFFNLFCSMSEVILGKQSSTLSSMYDNAVTEINDEMKTFNSNKIALIDAYATELINNKNSGMKHIFNDFNINKGIVFDITVLFLRVYSVIFIAMVCRALWYYIFTTYEAVQKRRISNNSNRVEELDDETIQQLETHFGKLFSTFTF